MLHKADTPFSYQITFPQSLALPDRLRVEKFMQNFCEVCGFDSTMFLLTVFKYG